MKYFLLSLVFLNTLFSADVSSGNNGAVAAVEINATRAGIEVLQAGGNAFDAAVTVATVLAVTHPQAGNIGGGGFIVLRSASGKIQALDFRETAPENASAEMYLDDKGQLISGKSLIGPLAAGTPGTVAGLWELHKNYGKISWKRCLQPAIALAENGFIVDNYLSDELQYYQQKMSKFKASEEIFYAKGSSPEEGERLIQSDLAKVLSAIAEYGHDGFYEGWVADKITDYMKNNGGLINHSDLSGYKPVWREPGVFQFNGYTISTMPLPSSAQFVLGQILYWIEPVLREHNFAVNSKEYIHLLAETEKLAFSDRNYYLADPDYIQYSVDSLLSPGYLNRRFLNITDKAVNPQDIHPGNIYIKEHEETTHFSIVDKFGNAVACTYTLNGNFGSKAVVPGTGILLNNEMDDFTSKPGEANMFGLKMSSANAIAPGKRMLSSMSPTIVTKGNSLFFVTGSPGGATILSTVLQTIVNACFYGYDLQETVTLPRFHHQDSPDSLKLEYSFKEKSNLIRELKSLGYHITWRKRLGDVHAILVRGEKISAFSDPRGRGKALAY